jgi:hypothetical protein
MDDSLITPRPWKSMIMECFFCGSQKDTHEIHEPGQNGMFGIYYCPEHHKIALKSMLHHCKKIGIFPITPEFVDSLHIEKDKFAVMRSNNSIQCDWSIGPIATKLSSGEIGIIVCRFSENIHKIIPVDELIKLNPSIPFDADEFKAQLIMFRHNLYSR